jgi:hypothetical protein
VLKNVAITIQRFGNVSRPCLDLRPCQCTLASCLPYAPTDAVLALNIAALSLHNARVDYRLPKEKYYGTCLNATKVSKLTNDLNCKYYQ